MNIKVFLKRFLCFICAAAMLFSCGTAAFATELDGEEYIETTTAAAELETTEKVPAATTRPLYLPPEAEPEDKFPVVFISRNNFSKKIHPGEAFNLTVSLSNSGRAPITSGVVTFTPSEGLILEETGSSKAVSFVGAGSSRSITVKLRAAKTVDNPAQSVIVDFKYYYVSAEGSAQGAESEKLNIPITLSGTSGVSSAATPYIIVSKYNYAGAVAAGQSFTLSVEFENTAKSIGVENIIMSVETAAGLSITSSSNTYYYTALAPGQKLTQTIAMQAESNAEPGSASVDISFKYEYTANGERVSANSGEVLSIPIFLRDRFTVSQPDVLFAVQNQELTISLPYVNKGKGTVSNVEAELICDNPDIYCELPNQNLGNLEPGKSGTIDFYILPSVAGEGNVTVEISYEDEMLQVKKLQIPVHFNAEQELNPIDEPYIDEPIDEPRTSRWYVWPACGVGVIAAAVILIVAIKKKKRKANEQIPDSFDWDDTPTSANASEQR